MSLPEHVKNQHVLVVDDYESMRDMVSDNLRQLGITNISVAASGNEANKIVDEKAGSDPVGVILSDLVMDDGTGLELTKMIRAKHAKTELPIIMITSQSEVGQVIECVKAGVNSYLIKPWTVEDLEQKLTDLADFLK